MFRRGLLGGGVWLAPPRAHAAQPLAAVDLRCEGAVDPLGVDAPGPRLSWRIASDRAGTVQAAYRVRAASRPELLTAGRADLWDSGRVVSSESHLVPWGGPALSSRQAAWWTVQAFTTDGRVSRSSAAARFELALLAAGDWRAQWIGASDGAGEQDKLTLTAPAPHLRRTFEVKKPVAFARAYVAGLGLFELRLDGRKVSEDVLVPAQSDYGTRRPGRLLYPVEDRSAKRIYYMTYDLGPLAPGPHAVGVVLGNGFFNQRDRVEEGWMWYGTPRLLAQIELTHTDGTRQVIATDGDWRVATGPLQHDGVFSGERHDVRLELGAWDRTAYDDAAWTPAAIVKAPGGGLVPALAPADRVHETLAPKSVTQPRPGVQRFDFGQNLSGWARVRVRGPRGRRVTMRFFEEQGSDYGQADELVLAGGEKQWEPRFTWHGFREVEVTGVTLAPADIEARVVHMPLPRTGAFTCGEPLLERIFAVYEWTQRTNIHGGVPSDCPHRERLGYGGDGQVTAEAVLLAFDSARFYRKWVGDLADAQNRQTGFVPHTAPFEGGGGGPAWGSALVIVPWLVYLYDGDRALLARHYQGMVRWLGYLQTRVDADGVVVKEEPGGWCLGDWCTPEKIRLPAELVNTAYLAHVADTLAGIAAVLGRAEDAVRFTGIKAHAARALHKRFYDPTRAQYADGHQGASVFPLAFGLVPPELVRPVAARLAEHVDKGCDGHFDTGILGTPLLLEVLTAHGRADLAYRLMTRTTYPGFGHMLAKGATTLWETWSGVGSHNHPMFGGACRWFWKGLGGIAPDPAAPGFARFGVRPAFPPGLAHARVEHLSPRGRVISGWRREGDRVVVTVEVPANAQATLSLPGRKDEALGSGRHQRIILDRNRAP